jgi:hypothetical protein
MDDAQIDLINAQLSRMAEQLCARVQTLEHKVDHLNALEKAKWESLNDVLEELRRISAVLYKATLPAHAGSLSASSVTTTYDADHDTAAERYAVAQHKLTLTLAAPEWVDDDAEYFVELTVDAAATSVVKLQGARANYDLRV